MGVTQVYFLLFLLYIISIPISLKLFRAHFKTLSEWEAKIEPKDMLFIVMFIPIYNMAMPLIMLLTDFLDDREGRGRINYDKLFMPEKNKEDKEGSEQ